MEQLMFDASEQLKALKDKKKSLDELVKANNAEIEQTERELTDLMVQSETQSFNRNGTLFYLQNKIYASAVADRKDELFATLRREGYGDLVYETVNANSLAAFTKEQMAENDDELPEWLLGLVNTFEKSTVGMRKGGKAS